MGCTSKKSIPLNQLKDNTDLKDEELDLELHDIEKQGESKHPNIEIKSFENKEKEEDNYYKYNLNDLISVNDSKMKVKRIENFEDESDSESSNENDVDNEILENNEQEEINENEKEIINDNKNEENHINQMLNDNDKKPEDKKPPNIEKLKKKGKERVEINLFS